MQKELLLELIGVAIGNHKSLSGIPSEEEWRKVYEEAQKQSVLGVAFEGVKLLPHEQYPPQSLLFQWIGEAERISAQNKIVNIRTAELLKHFADEGFRGCILKGQGNARMYPNPYSRTSGDIDIWIEGGRGRIKKFVTSKFPTTQDGEKHILYPIYKDVTIEVHYKPSTLRIPKYDRRLQAFFAKHASEQFDNSVDLPDGEGMICVPKATFNAVYQMAHLMSHFFVEGVGLRQFLDYYYVLKELDGKGLKEGARETYAEFGMLRFAMGVMWIEKKCLGIDDKLLPVEPDEQIGKYIMTEMMAGGNFGYYDKRYKTRKNGFLARGVTDTYRLLKLARVFPGDAIWKIWGKIVNQKWKLK